MLFSPIQMKLLLTGIELSVFQHLSLPISAEAVAQTIQTHPINTRIFLDSLAAIDLVQKTQGLYQNSQIAQTFLAEDSSTYLGQLFTFMTQGNAALENLTTLVKNGPPPPPDTQEVSEDMLAQSAVLMANTERAGDAQRMVQIVSALPEFSSCQTMLDLGGGPGLIGMAIVDAHPSMTGVIFDLPPVVQVAKTFVKEYAMEDRMTIMGGNFNTDAIGEGYDLVVTCNALQFAQSIDSVVKKIYTALNLGGVCVSLFGFGHTHEGTKPVRLVLGLLSMALMGQELGIEQGYIANAMLRAGFTSVHSSIVDTAWGSMELDIARK